MLAAKILKVFARYKQKLGICRSRSRRWITAAVKHRKLRKRAAQPFDGQHLFWAFRRYLKNADLSRDNEVEPLTRIAFTE